MSSFFYTIVFWDLCKDKPAKSKTNLAISDRRINPPVLEYSFNWTHIQRIMRESNPEARSWYLRESNV